MSGGEPAEVRGTVECHLRLRAKPRNRVSLRTTPKLFQNVNREQPEYSASQPILDRWSFPIRDIPIRLSPKRTRDWRRPASYALLTISATRMSSREALL